MVLSILYLTGNVITVLNFLLIPLAVVSGPEGTMYFSTVLFDNDQLPTGAIWEVSSSGIIDIIYDWGFMHQRLTCLICHVVNVTKFAGDFSGLSIDSLAIESTNGTKLYFTSATTNTISMINSTGEAFVVLRLLILMCVFNKVLMIN